MLKGLMVTALACGLLSLIPSAADATGCRAEVGQVLIPAGVFWTGSDILERSLAESLSSPETVADGWFSDEAPRFRTESQAFRIDGLLVPQAQYRDFVKPANHTRPEISRA